MGTEEQTQYTGVFTSVTGNVRWGQRLTVPNRIVSKLSFPLIRIGSPGGTLTFYIYKVSDGGTIVYKDWGNSNDVPLTMTWLEVTFDTPTLINEEVRVMVGATTGSAGNLIQVYYKDSDVKADEYTSKRTDATNYTDYTSYDSPYIYTYTLSQEHGGGIYPVDDVARVSSIRHICQPGFFRMQVGLGDLGFDVDVAESAVRRALDTAKEVEAELGFEEGAPPIRAAKPTEAVEEAGAPSAPAPPPSTLPAPGPGELTEYAKKIIETRKPAMEVLRIRAKAEELGVAAVTARTVEIFMKEPEKIALLQEIERLSRSAAAPGITPYARDVLQRAIKRKQDELTALYRKG